MGKEWITIKLPKDLVDRIDNLIESGRYGYTSRADFVSDAVRRLLKEYGYL